MSDDMPFWEILGAVIVSIAASAAVVGYVVLVFRVILG